MGCDGKTRARFPAQNLGVKQKELSLSITVHAIARFAFALTGLIASTAFFIFLFNPTSQTSGPILVGASTAASLVLLYLFDKTLPAKC